MQLTLDMRIVRKPDLLMATLDQEVVMLDVASGRYHGLNDVANFLWQRMERPVDLASLCRAVEAEYEVDPAACEKDVLRFVGMLLRQRVAEIVNSA